MSNVVTFPRSQVGEPEWRSALLAEAIRRTAHIAGPIDPWALKLELQSWLGQTEEECGGEILDVLSFMVRSNLFLSNTMDWTHHNLTLGADTRLTASGRLTMHIYADREGDPDAPDAA